MGMTRPVILGHDCRPWLIGGKHRSSSSLAPDSPSQSTSLMEASTSQLLFIWLLQPHPHPSPLRFPCSAPLRSNGFFLDSVLPLACESESHSVVSYSLQPQGLYSSWNSLGQNIGVGKPFPSPGDLPNPGIEPRSPVLQVDSLPAEPQGEPFECLGLSQRGGLLLKFSLSSESGLPSRFTWPFPLCLYHLTLFLLTPKHLILGILSNFYFFCSLLFSYPSFPPNQRL